MNLDDDNQASDEVIARRLSACASALEANGQDASLLREAAEQRAASAAEQISRGGGGE